MKFPKFIIIPLTALLLSGCIMPGGGGGSSSSSSQPDDEPQVIADDYYDLTNYNLNGTVGPALQFELHKFMLDTHTSYITYGQVNNYLGVTADRPTSSDQYDKDTPMNELFYTGKLIPQGQTASREHVWPCANSGNLWYHGKTDSSPYNVDNSTYVGGGSDLYHVRPANDVVNTARGNSKFKEFTAAEIDSGSLNVATDGGPYYLLSTASSYSTYAEPDDHFKGDIARLIMYVYIHYSKIGNYNNNVCGPLSLRNVMYAQTDQEMYEMMVRWNELDPVSETEKLRNDTIQKIQGNRNPFVDYPHLMAKCFGL